MKLPEDLDVIAVPRNCYAHCCTCCLPVRWCF